MPFCTYCGHEISDQTTTCPNCGQPNPARTGIPEVEFTKPAPGLELAGFGRRFVGLAIDGIIIAIIASPFGRSVHLGRSDITFRYNPGTEVIHFVYAWLMIGLNRGQTLGSMIMGVRVMRPGGGAVDLGRAAARAAMAFVSGLAIGLGYLWAAWEPERRTWHDMVADTRVYRTR